MAFFTSATGIPELPGAYVLAVDLWQPLTVKLGGRLPGSLAAGLYLYCGSAKGPGGLRARLSRHMRRDKPTHWHIDNLTEAGRALGAWTFVEGDECDLVAALAYVPIAMEGFGNSDCRRCKSHLLALEATRPVDQGARAILSFLEPLRSMTVAPALQPGNHARSGPRNMPMSSGRIITRSTECGRPRRTSAVQSSWP